MPPYSTPNLPDAILEIAGLEEVRAVGRVGRVKPVIKVGAGAVAIVVENLLYRKMRQAGWRLRP